MNLPAPRLPSPRVLVLGASGFVGRHLVQALQCAGATVVRGVRRARQADEIAIDFTRDLDPEIWRPRLDGIDVVINAVGILQERPGAPFDAIHRAAPLAVLRACERAGVARFIQISALGSGASRDPLGYFATKTAAEETLLASPSVTAVIIRPSLVFGEDGASSAVMLAAASLPIHFLPGDGAQLVQPVHVDDLALLVARLACAAECRAEIIAAVGPEPISYARMLAVYRRNLGFGTPWQIKLPLALVQAAVRVLELLPQQFASRETLAMLLRGNAGDPSRLRELLGRSPIAPENFVTPAARDRLRLAACWQWLAPLAQLSLAIVWLISGLLALRQPDAQVTAWLARLGLDEMGSTIARFAGAALDVCFAIASLAWPRRALWSAQALVVLVYTVLATIAAPEAWLHPFGPLLKNLPILALLAVLWAAAQARKS